MPQLEYFIVCRSVHFDLHTDEISLMHVLEDVFPEAFPHVIPRVCAVSSWNVKPEEADADFQATLIIRVPGNDDVSFSANLDRERHRHRAIQGVMEIPVDGPGDINFEVLMNGKHEASHTIRVHPLDMRQTS